MLMQQTCSVQTWEVDTVHLDLQICSFFYYCVPLSAYLPNTLLKLAAQDRSETKRQSIHMAVSRLLRNLTMHSIIQGMDHPTMAEKPVSHLATRLVVDGGPTFSSEAAWSTQCIWGLAISMFGASASQPRCTLRKIAWAKWWALNWLAPNWAKWPFSWLKCPHGSTKSGAGGGSGLTRDGRMAWWRLGLGFGRRDLCGTLRRGAALGALSPGGIAKMGGTTKCWRCGPLRTTSPWWSVLSLMRFGSCWSETWRAVLLEMWHEVTVDGWRNVSWPDLWTLVLGWATPWWGMCGARQVRNQWPLGPAIAAALLQKVWLEWVSLLRAWVIVEDGICQMSKSYVWTC